MHRSSPPIDAARQAVLAVQEPGIDGRQIASRLNRRSGYPFPPTRS